MVLALSPMRSLLQIARRRRTSRLFTTNVFNTVEKLLTSATVIIKSCDETHSPARKYPNVHLEKGRSGQAADTFDLYH